MDSPACTRDLCSLSVCWGFNRSVGKLTPALLPESFALPTSDKLSQSFCLFVILDVSFLNSGLRGSVWVLEWVSAPKRTGY